MNHWQMRQRLMKFQQMLQQYRINMYSPSGEFFYCTKFYNVLKTHLQDTLAKKERILVLMTDYINGLLEFITAGSSMFLAANEVKKILQDQGFEDLDAAANISKGGLYYKLVNDSAIFAFKIGSSDLKYKIIGTHLDAPGFRIKSNPITSSQGYVELNTEVYGGPIINTWFDRPLSISGRVCVKSDNVLRPSTILLDAKEPLMVIPNLAIHQNREVNDGVKLNPQKETLPIITYTNEEVNQNLLFDYIAAKLSIASEDILDLDLFLYPVETGCLVGLDKKFISSPRLDDLSMTYSGLMAFIESDPAAGVNVLACYDNEEVGSRSIAGANSPNLLFMLEKIALGLGKNRAEFIAALDDSFIISADVAHLSHPNYPEKLEPTNKVTPGGGVAIKISSNCSYTTNANTSAVFKAICQNEDVPYQTFMNRSDTKGGSTIGPITSSQTGIRSVDLGTPMLSMHSARELMAAEDLTHTIKIFRAFYRL